MKHLHEKNEQFAEPSADILDTFPDPGVHDVRLTQKECTAVCPKTGQPDYYTVDIQYTPTALCLESKSLKLYLAAYRNVGIFAETLSHRICKDVMTVLDAEQVIVTVTQVPRGGISIEATTTCYGGGE